MTAGRGLLIPVIVQLLLVSFPLDFKKEAKSAMDGENWTRLEEVARGELQEDPESRGGRAYLAVSLAGQHKFEESAQELKALEEQGHSPTRGVSGLSNPMEKVVNVIYMTCWANFNADYNWKAWLPLFDAFEEMDAVATPASRLLMAALKKKDEAGIERFESWFDERLEKYKDNPARIGNLQYSFVQGYLRAGVANERVLAMAESSFQRAWEAAEYSFRKTEDPLELREKCDVDTDHQHNNICLAYHLCRVFDPPDNVLAAQEAEPGAVFEDVTEKAGLEGFRFGRVAAADFDGDGYCDLCFSGRLFKNEKGKRFKEVTKEAGLTKKGTGALFFDFDNDGCLDILVTAQPHPHLFRNKGRRGKYAFEDVTAAAGLDKMKIGSPPDGAAVTDIDNDGWLEFYLAAYENPYPKGHPDLLVRNNGDGTFTDVSESSGILKGGALCGRGVTCCDFDFDGDADIYVSNYRLLVNLFWRNDGEGRFTNIAAENGTQGLEQKGSFGHTIGSCFGDIDNDGDFDLFCANLAHPRYITQGFSNLSMLYVNSGAEGGFGFTDERRARGIRFQETLSDPAFADYDNDGDLDLYVTSVYVGVPTVFFQNDGKGFFEPITFRSRSMAFHGWGQAWFDMDNDGDLDHVVGSSSGVRLFRNEGNDNKWVRVKLKGKKHNLFGVGALVKVSTPEGLTRISEVRVGRGTQSQDEPVLHFGLGKEASSVKVEVTWPTGFTDTMTGRPNKTIEVRQRKHWKKKKK